ncbi:MAG: VCBS repeat-containing protein [Gemmatimonadetes bacterium]|nr:VCBS repeat-containing protein [Gemmatimonadota bacterium]
MRAPVFSAAVCLAAACADAPPLPSARAAAPAASGAGGALFVDVTETHVPLTAGSSMDAQAFDADGDGDLDLLIAKEMQRNVLLLNDGTGRFSDASQARLPYTLHDSEDVAVADFDGDGDPDAVVAGEDDQVSEFYLNAGGGFFTAAGSLLPAMGTAQSVVAADVDGDGDADLLFGNHGQNFLFINGGGRFSDQTRVRLPAAADLTQDIEVGDVDGDGDLDVVLGNVDANRILLNDGRGFFTDATAGRLPLRASIEETREAELADVDGDGDLDLYFANVAFVPGADPQDRLLINDGRGYFSDQTARRIGRETAHTPEAEFVDVDRDGDLDLVTANFRDTKAYRVSLNDGTGVFREATGSVFPAGLTGEGVDVEVADFNGDGVLDIYLCSYVGTDRLILGRP